MLRKENHSLVDGYVKATTPKPIKESKEEVRDDIIRFEEIMQEMRGLVDEALEITRSSDSGVSYERAKSYWYPHILGAIDKENSGYLGGSMVDMAATLGEMREYEEEMTEDSGDAELEKIKAEEESEEE